MTRPLLLPSKTNKVTSTKPPPRVPQYIYNSLNILYIVDFATPRKKAWWFEESSIDGCFDNLSVIAILGSNLPYSFQTGLSFRMFLVHFITTYFSGKVLIPRFSCIHFFFFRDKFFYALLVPATILPVSIKKIEKTTQLVV